MSDAATPASVNAFQALDDSKISKFQIKTMFVSGMGFFTDAYDLFVPSRRSCSCTASATSSPSSGRT